MAHRFIVAVLTAVAWVAACGGSDEAGDAGSGGDDGAAGSGGAAGGGGGSGGGGGGGGAAGDGGAADVETLMTFVVTMPANTPAEDNVYLQSGPFVAVKMTRVDATTWTLAVPSAQIRIGPERDAGPFAMSAYKPDTMELEYAYTRGQGFYGGEFFADDPVQEAWNVHRHASAASAMATTVRDTVLRWRWFPTDAEALPKYDATLTDFDPRTTGWPFMAGVMLDDYWNDEMVPLIPTTHVAAKRLGVDTIEVAPPWDYTAVDPLPVIGNVGAAKSQYTDEALRAHLKAIKADGLRIFLEPQICCTAMPGTVSPAWVDAWFAQFEAFYVHHAKIAEEIGVEAMLMDWSGGQLLPAKPNAPADAVARWKKLVAAVRAVYKGKLGFNLLLFQMAGQRDAPTFWIDLEPLAGEFDFLGMSIWQGFATTKDATQADIDAEVEATFSARMDPVFAGSGLPHILTQVAYGSFDGAAIGDLDVDEVALPPFGPEKDAKLPYDGVEQAMIFQAIMKAVAARPHVVGVFPFLTHYLALPKAPDQSVRGKAAEGVLSSWYAAAKK